ncbi:MAG: hypothetical protein R2746_16075 [Acidimicrobiales bacterium]
MLEPFVPKSVKVAEAPAKGRSILTHAPVAQRRGVPRAGGAAAGQEGQAIVTDADETDVDGGRAPAGRRASGRRRSLDPQGRRALFETPVSAARDTIRSGAAREGKDALYSTGPRQSGTVVVSCSGCRAHPHQPHRPRPAVAHRVGVAAGPPQQPLDALPELRQAHLVLRRLAGVAHLSPDGDPDTHPGECAVPRPRSRGSRA